MYKCFFIGHRFVPEKIEPLLCQAIHKHITEYGVTEFYVGHYGKFDHMVIRALRKMKELHPQIKNFLLLAYHPTVQPIKKPKGFESTLFIEGQESVPPRFAIARLNRQMIKEADYLISYVQYITDGSYKLLEYAKTRAEKGKPIITNLAAPL